MSILETQLVNVDIYLWLTDYLWSRFMVTSHIKKPNTSLVGMVKSIIFYLYDIIFRYKGLSWLTDRKHSLNH